MAGWGARTIHRVAARRAFVHVVGRRPVWRFRWAVFAASRDVAWSTGWWPRTSHRRRAPSRNQPTARRARGQEGRARRAWPLSASRRAQRGDDRHARHVFRRVTDDGRHHELGGSLGLCSAATRCPGTRWPRSRRGTRRAGRPRCAGAGRQGRPAPCGRAGRERRSAVARRRH